MAIRFPDVPISNVLRQAPAIGEKLVAVDDGDGIAQWGEAYGALTEEELRTYVGLALDSTPEIRATQLYWKNVEAIVSSLRSYAILAAKKKRRDVSPDKGVWSEPYVRAEALIDALNRLIPGDHLAHHPLQKIVRVFNWISPFERRRSLDIWNEITEVYNDVAAKLETLGDFLPRTT